MENTLQTSKELVENIVKGVHARPLLVLAASNLATGLLLQCTLIPFVRSPSVFALITVLVSNFSHFDVEASGIS